MNSSSPIHLTINTDGGARGNPGPAAIGVVIQDQNAHVLYEKGQYIGEQTNNVAEYEALTHAVEWLSRFCAQTQVEDVQFLLDSKLVIEQVNGNWKVKEAHLQTLHQKVRALLTALPCSFRISYVPRAQNAAADALVNQALDAQTV